MEAGALVNRVHQYVKADPAADMAFQALSPYGNVYVVGGAPRDIVLGKSPKDIDMMAQIDPQTIDEVLSKIPGGKLDYTGKNFGVYRFKYQGSEVEIALPRTEVSTGDGHKDFDVKTDHNLPVEHDLKRRDFTGNSIAVNLNNGQVHDPHNGVFDLLTGQLRTVSPSAFKEDPLRTIRALVSRSRHGLEPDAETMKQMAQHAEGIKHLPGDRIFPELEKIMKGQEPHEAIRLGHDTQVLHHFLPEVASAFGFDQKNPHHKLDLGSHLLEVLKNVAAQTDDPDVRLAGLLHDIGKPHSQWIDENGVGHYYKSADGRGDDHEKVGAKMAEDVLRRLRYPANRIAKVSHLIEHHMFPDFNSGKGARRFLQRAGSPEAADNLLAIRQADHMGKGNEAATVAMVDKMRGLVSNELNAGAKVNVGDLAVNGQDVMRELNIPPGRAVGEKLRSLMEMVIDDPSLNTRDQLLGLLHTAKVEKKAMNEFQTIIQDQVMDPEAKLQRMFLTAARNHAQALGIEPEILANRTVWEWIQQYFLDDIHAQQGLGEQQWWNIFREMNQLLDQAAKHPQARQTAIDAGEYYDLPPKGQSNQDLQLQYDKSLSFDDHDFLNDLGIDPDFHKLTKVKWLKESAPAYNPNLWQTAPAPGQPTWNFLPYMNEIAQIYAKLPMHQPGAERGWSELAQDAHARSGQLRQQYNVKTVQFEPYENAEQQDYDVKNYNQFLVSDQNSEHPLWDTNTNVAFRTVHDLMGHIPSNGDFSWEGENRACSAHFPLLTPEARKALFTECIGQTAFVNVFKHFGPQKVAYFPNFDPDQGYIPQGPPDPNYSPNGNAGMIYSAVMSDIYVEEGVQAVKMGKDAGYSWVGADLSPYQGHSGYISAFEGMAKAVPVESLTAETIHQYQQEHMSQFQADPSLLLGIWNDGSRVWLDVSKVFANEQDALAFSVANNQEAYYDVANDNVIYTQEALQGQQNAENPALAPSIS